MRKTESRAGLVPRIQRLIGFCRGLRSESGSALVELSFIMAFLGIPLLLGTADLAPVVYDSIEVSNAAHAAALYGSYGQSNASNTSAITTAAQNEAQDFGTSLNVTPTTYYVCSLSQGGTTYTTSAAATSACTGTYGHALQYVKVVVSASVTPLVKLPGLPNPWPLTSTSVMEVQE